MKTWFTSDLHFFHSNIILYTHRPWLQKGDTDEKGHWISKEIAKKRVEEMNADLIKNWNERIKEDDLVFELGDFNFKNSSGGKVGEGEPVSYRDIDKLLNGNIIHIRGNHSSNNGLRTPIEKIIIKYGGHQMCLIHNPLHVDYRYSINLVGHIHNAWKFRRIKTNNDFVDLINVGIDVNNFRPVCWEELHKEYKQWLKTLELKKSESQKIPTSQNIPKENEEKDLIKP